MNELICKEENCSTSAKYNVLFQKPALYCCKHKKDGMVNISTKYCIENDCYLTPSFNYENLPKRFCKIHKKDNMINVKHKKCEFNEDNNKCTFIASYNLKNQPAKFCKIHKTDEMVDSRHKLCIFENCDKRPLYNDNGKTPLYCKDHKNNDMTDVNNKIKCMTTVEECGKSPTYNYEGLPPRYCTQHKEDGMIDSKHSKCKYMNNTVQCKNIAYYSYKNTKVRIYCNLHKKDNMENLSCTKCTNCKLFYVTNKTNYLCSYCNTNKPKIQLTKELNVKKLFDKHNLIYTYNKYIQNDCCYKYRPDFVFDCITFFIIVEVDENAHKQYDKNCELIRMNNIQMSIGLPCKFIRYNPDNKKFSKEEKEEKLIKILKEYLNKNYEELKTEEPLYLYYEN